MQLGSIYTWGKRNNGDHHTKLFTISSTLESLGNKEYNRQSGSILSQCAIRTVHSSQSHIFSIKYVLYLGPPLIKPLFNHASPTLAEDLVQQMHPMEQQIEKLARSQYSGIHRLVGSYLLADLKKDAQRMMSRQLARGRQTLTKFNHEPLSKE